jgi:hypothetical protein
MNALHHHNIPFTWSDIDSSLTAWKASTGSNIPSDDDPPTLKKTWERFALDCLLSSEWEEVPLMRYTTRSKGWQRLGTSLHLNVQQFVFRTREQFLASRTVEATFFQREINTVGHTQCDAWWWGWSAVVESNTLPRMCWSAKVVRQNRYFYPRPGTDEFYVGSSIIRQKNPRELDIDHHYKWWKREWETVATNGDFCIVEQPVHGWRPVGEPGKITVLEDGNINIFPMSASGVKYGPFVAEEIVGILENGE